MIKLIGFEVNGRGFDIEYHEEGTAKEKEDKYWIFFVDGKERIHLISLREDECILLSALLNFGVHKKLVEVDGVGCEKKDFYLWKKQGGKKNE